MRKKKFLSLLLTFAMMMCLMPVKIFSAGSVTLSVSPSEVSAAPTGEITFTLKMGPVANAGNIEVRCVPSDGLTIESAEPNTSLKSLSVGKFANADFDVQTNGTVRFNGTVAADDGYSSTSDTILGTFTCKVKNDATENQTISLTEELVGDALNFEEMEVTTTGAEVTVTPAQVSASSVSLEPTSITLEVGSTQQLTATLTPSNATDTLNWSSDNTDAATVNNTGLVTAVNVGLATITVRAGDNGPTATCQVTVEAQACNHPSLQTIDAVDATCEVKGNNKYYYCPDCDKYFKDNNGAVGQETTVDAETINPSGHEYYYVSKEDGSVHYKKCKNCNLSEEEEHDWQHDVILQDATEDTVGLKGKQCSLCGFGVPSEDFIKPGTCPNKCYQKDEEVYISEADVMSTEETATLDGKDVKIIVQDPLRVFAGSTLEIEIAGITSDLGADYDGNISIEKAYKAKINLYKETVTHEGPDGVHEIIHREPVSELPGFVRLLLEIPDDPNDPNDDWDDDEIQVQRINIGEDTEYVERIEYQVYDADGNFVKVVEKGYVPGDGETLRKFAVIWTNHFSDYTPIDPEDQVETTATTTESGASAQAKAGNGLKTGESLNEVYLAGLLLAAAILVIYLSLKKRREA